MVKSHLETSSLSWASRVRCACSRACSRAEKARQESTSRKRIKKARQESAPHPQSRAARAYIKKNESSTFRFPRRARCMHAIRRINKKPLPATTSFVIPTVGRHSHLHHGPPALRVITFSPSGSSSRQGARRHELAACVTTISSVARLASQARVCRLR